MIVTLVPSNSFLMHTQAHDASLHLSFPLSIFPPWSLSGSLSLSSLYPSLMITHTLTEARMHAHTHTYKTHISRLQNLYSYQVFHSP